MARDVGRPLATLVSSGVQRSILDGLVRCHRVVRSMSDHPNMILRCADELGNKAVAVEVDVHEHAIGNWRRRFLKVRIDGLSDQLRPGHLCTINHREASGGRGD